MMKIKKYSSLSFNCVTGRFGTWQILVFGLLAFVCLLDGLYENLYAFTAFTPKYRCSIPFCEHPLNATYSNEEKTQEKGNFPIYVQVTRNKNRLNVFKVPQGAMRGS